MSDTELSPPTSVRPRKPLAASLATPLAALSAGAAAIHFAFAPAHFDHGTTHGLFFLVVAWVQVGLALALVRWRGHRVPLVTAGVVNAAVIGVWIVSRTVGVPGEEAEAVGLPDVVATVLEALIVAGALVGLRAGAARPVAPRLRLLGAVAGATALIAAVSASVTPSLAGDAGPTAHSHGHAAAGAGSDDHHGDDHGAGDHHGGGEAAEPGHHHEAAAGAVDPADRCDLGFNTAAFNAASEPGTPHAHDDTSGVDFTLEEWAEVFVDPADGLPREVVVQFLEDTPTLRDGILSGGLTHSLGPDPWVPMTDPAECRALADELQRARAVAARYPTIADAEAAGYRRVTTYLPGIAAHYIRYDVVDGHFVVEEPEMLLYDGDGPQANIVGLSYYILSPGDEPPEVGFTGPNDHYHRHLGLCMRDGVVVAGSSSTPEQCAALGGQKADGGAGWMSHVWIVPGCESDWGLFSGANPLLKVRGLDASGPMPPGCGTGRTLDDPLAFDDPGSGPGL